MVYNIYTSKYYTKKVYDSLSSERLLVMERFRGVPLTDLEGIRTCTSDPEATLITALNTWSMSVMMAESFHAVRQAPAGVNLCVCFGLFCYFYFLFYYFVFVIGDCCVLWMMFCKLFCEWL